MLKEILIGVLVLGLAMTGVAVADKLDPNWSLTRKEANALGDAAKAGQAGAYQTLVNKAAFRHAPAAHNIGWLYQKGFPGKPADRKKACGWFGKAATLGYPPSMHEYGLCLFGMAKNAKDKEARTKLEQQAYQVIFNASKAGWTKSALYMSEKILNLPLPSKKDFSIAGIVIGFGLNSNPAHEQKVTLSYFEGMRVIYGSGSGSHYYKRGRDALRFADKNGNSHARKALPTLYTKWVRSLIKSMAVWSPPEQSGLDCYRKKQANLTDKRATVLKCGGLDNRKRKNLERLIKDSETLQFEVNGRDKAELKLAKDRLNDRSAQFRADSKKLADIIIQNLLK